MNEFFAPDPLSIGSKGLVYIGEKILVYQRDDKTDKYPLCIDLPGGGPEPHETPFHTFKREVKEEFGLDIAPGDITYVRRYPSSIEPDKSTYFPVAKLPREAEQNIVFGEEGIAYFLLSIEAYLAQRTVAWPMLQERVIDYIKALNER